MFDPKKLLDDLLGSQGQGRGLGQILGQNSGSGGNSSTGNMVRDKAGQAIQMAKDNPLAAGALAAVLLGTGTGRSLAGSAIKLGGLAAIGGLAYKAYQNYQAGQQPAQAARAEPELLPPPSDTGFHPSQAPQGEAEFTLTLVRAMIAAAKADGQVDDAERAKIVDRLSSAGLQGEAEQFLMDEIRKPLDIDALAKGAQTEEQKVELFTAARLAVDADSRAERGFLDMLAGRLNLPDALVDHIEATVASAKSAAADAPSGPVPVSDTGSAWTRAEAGVPASTGEDPPSRSRW